MESHSANDNRELRRRCSGEDRRDLKLEKKEGRGGSRGGNDQGRGTVCSFVTLWALDQLVKFLAHITISLKVVLTLVCLFICPHGWGWRREKDVKRTLMKSVLM